MNLEHLIKEGEDVRRSCAKQGVYSIYLTGEAYELWISKCIIFLESNQSLNGTLVDRFKKAAETAVGNDTSYFDTMMGVLKAFQAMGQASQAES